MRDSKWRSLEEALLNVVIGFLIGIALNMFVLPPLLGIPFDAVPLDIAIYISIIYGGISIVRSFILRRMYITVRKRWRIW